VIGGKAKDGNGKIVEEAEVNRTQMPQITQITTDKYYKLK